MGALGDIGSGLDAIGGLLGFKKGGRVPGRKGKGRVAVVHGGEVVIPNTLPGLQREALKKINMKKRK